MKENTLDLKKIGLSLFLEDLDKMSFSTRGTPLIIDVAVDTEYKGREIFTAQLYIPIWNEKVMIFNIRMLSRYPENKLLIESLGLECVESGNCTRAFFLDLEDNDACNIRTVLERIAKERAIPLKEYKVNVLFYFAVNDLYPLFGYNNCIVPMLRGNDLRRFSEKLYQLRNVKGMLKTVLDSGDEIEFKISDLSGLFSKQSLKNSALSCGINMENKDALDEYKEDMSKALLHPDRRIRDLYYSYGIDDAIVLVDIKQRFLKQTNDLLTNLYNFDERFLFTSNNLPSTVGTLVAKSFQNYIYLLGERECESLHYFQWALCRIGYLSPDNFNLDRHREIRKRLIEDTSYLTDPDFPKGHLSDSIYAFNGLSLGSVYALLSAKPHTMLSTCATVTGGRCVNERYAENCFENVLDMDFSSCYGSSLKDLTFPIGRPKVMPSCKTTFCKKVMAVQL